MAGTGWRAWVLGSLVQANSFFSESALTLHYIKRDRPDKVETDTMLQYNNFQTIGGGEYSIYGMQTFLRFTRLWMFLCQNTFRRKTDPKCPEESNKYMWNMYHILYFFTVFCRAWIGWRCCVGLWSNYSSHPSLPISIDNHFQPGRQVKPNIYIHFVDMIDCKSVLIEVTLWKQHWTD